MSHTAVAIAPIHDIVDNDIIWGSWPHNRTSPFLKAANRKPNGNLTSDMSVGQAETQVRTAKWSFWMHNA